MIYVAWVLAHKQEKVNDLWSVPLPCLLVVGSMAFLVVIEPDLGSAVIPVVAVGVMVFVAGLRWRYAFGFLGIGALGFLAAVVAEPYRMVRLMSFLDPWADPLGRGYQLCQSQIAFGNGGLAGMGMGGGGQRALFLPAPHTDFIYSVVGEDYGLVGCSVVLVAFLFLFWRGLRTALRAPDRFGFYLALGITCLLVALPGDADPVLAALFSKYTKADRRQWPADSHSGTERDHRRSDGARPQGDGFAPSRHDPAPHSATRRPRPRSPRPWPPTRHKLLMFDDSESLDENDPAVQAFFARYGQGGQDLNGEETVVEGSPAYLAEDPQRDASYEEIAHLIQNTGITAALPAMQQQLDDALAAALAAGRYRPLSDLPEADYDDEYLAIGLETYQGIWAHNPNGDGTGGDDEFDFSTRQALASGDPALHAVIEGFFPANLAFTADIDPAFAGTFSLAHQASNLTRCGPNTSSMRASQARRPAAC